jgi:glutaredoxin/glutathione-dependent peroxiredoxin
LALPDRQLFASPSPTAVHTEEHDDTRIQTDRQVGMAIKTGDRIPDVEVRTMGPDGPQAVRTGEVLGTGRVVLFAVPGAFTPGCSKIHLPGFVQHADELSAKGVDRVACVGVNDAWVMDAWGKSQGVGDKILMLADGNADFTRAMGLELDGSGIGLGVRSQRYAAVIEDGIVTRLDVEKSPGVDVSSCEAVLSRL